MKTLMITLILCTSSYAAKSLKAHKHGHLKLNLAAENKTVFLEILGPTDSFLGFEHKPKTQEEKSKYAKLQEVWKKKNASVFSFAKDKGCKITSAEVVWEEEDDHGHEHGHGHGKKKKHKGEHSELHLSVKYNCQSKMEKTAVAVNVSQVISDLDDLDVTVFPSSGDPVKSEFSKPEFKLEL